MLINKEVIFKLLALSIGIGLSLFLGELVSRVFYFGKDGLSIEKVNSFVPLGLSGLIKEHENKKVLYELKPNLDSYFKLKEFRTNSQSLRDKEYTIKKPYNTKRGVVIGDSFTMGSGVDIEDVYHSMVEKALNEQGDSIKFELINFGVGGYNLLNYLGVLEAKVLKYSPDFIIIGFCGVNDFRNPSEKHYAGEFKPQEKVRFQFFLERLVQRANFTKPKRRGGRNPITKSEKKFTDTMFNEFRVYSDKHAIPIIIQYLSIIPNNENLTTIKGLAEKNGLYFLDSDGKFDNKELKKYFIVPGLDPHPNRLANSIFANTLLSYQPFMDILYQRETKDN